MRNLILVAIMIILTSGCAYRIQAVHYGVDEMGPYDKRMVNEVLTTLPICQRWSWTNDQLGRSYTMRTVAEYQSDINKQCKIYSLDTVYVVNSARRKNKRVVERACKQSYDNHWTLEPTDDFFGFKVGSDLRYYTPNNVDEHCATRKRYNERF